jgi:hypothetical protein
VEEETVVLCGSMHVKEVVGSATTGRVVQKLRVAA